MDKIIGNLKKARIKQFYKYGLIFLLFVLLIVILVSGEGSYAFFVLLFSIPGLYFGVLTIKYLVLFFNLDNCLLFFRLNKYGTKEQIADFFCNQISKKVYEDENIIITPKLFISKKNYEDTFLNSDILDITRVVHRVNSVIDFISIEIFYNDGKYYKIKYKRPFGLYNMEKKANDVLYAVNILADNCKNLRSKKNML